MEMFTCFSKRISLIKQDKEKICPSPNNPLIIILAISISFINLVLGCIIALFYKYNLQIKLFLYSRNWCLWWIKENDIDKDKKYDIFLSFCHEDQDFVMSEIVRNLEEGEKPFKICIHSREWEQAEWIHKNILRSILESRRTVIFLSKNFLHSNWSMMEFKTAYQNMMNEKRLRLIVILYDDIGPLNNVDPELRQYLETKTYISWNDSNFWRKFLFSLPRVTDINVTDVNK